MYENVKMKDLEDLVNVKTKAGDARKMVQIKKMLNQITLHSFLYLLAIDTLFIGIYTGYLDIAILLTVGLHTAIRCLASLRFIHLARKRYLWLTQEGQT